MLHRKVALIVAASAMAVMLFRGVWETSCMFADGWKLSSGVAV